MKTRRDIINPSHFTIACLVALVSATVLYLYFLNMSVVQVVMRIEYTQKQNDLNADIASLDAKFIEAQHAIVTRLATTEDYQTDTNKIFVAREQPRLVMNGQ